MTTAAAVPDSAVAASFAQSWPAIADLAVTKEELLAVPVPVILGVALVVGVGVNAAIVVGAGAFAASKDDDAERATLTSPATSDRETNNRPASASASASDDEPDESDDFDLESILSLVEDAEAAEIERKVSESPGRDVYEPASFAQMVSDAADAVRAAVADGQNLLEVQLPSTAATVDSDASQAVNLRLAAAFGDDFVRRGECTHIAIFVPLGVLVWAKCDRRFFFLNREPADGAPVAHARAGTGQDRIRARPSDVRGGGVHEGGLREPPRAASGAGYEVASR